MKKKSTNLLHRKLDQVAAALERTNMAEYVNLMQRPFKMMFLNFISGISRGFGIAIGMTLVAAIIIIIITKILAQLITLPFIGEQIAQMIELVNQYLKEGSKLNIGQ